MSNFFDSEIIQNELKEINELQKDIYVNIFDFRTASQNDKLEHVEKLSELLEKQKIMYTRLSLSDDPKAVEMKQNLKQTLSLIGMSPDTDMHSLFNSLGQTIESLRNHISS